jgi:beta-glucosidase
MPDRARWLAPRVVAFAAIALSGSSAAETPAGDLVIFDGSPRAPFAMFVGDEANWAVPVDATDVKSAAGLVSVETDPESGARRLVWSGQGEAQLYFAAPEGLDLSAYASGDAALVVLLRVDTPPKKRVALRMGCGYPCAAEADIRKLLRALPVDQWVRASFDLKCFAEQGLDVTRVDTPFLLLSPGQLGLSIAAVGIVPGLGPDATIRCR